jgi:hypothetical protein
MASEPKARDILTSDDYVPVDVWMPRFLEGLRATGVIRAACKYAGVTRPLVFGHRKRSATFAQAWDEALQDAVDSVELAMLDRVKAGSDSMIQFYLRSRRKDVYGDVKTVEHKLSAQARREIEALAAKEGLDAAEIIREAEALLIGGRG